MGEEREDAQMYDPLGSMYDLEDWMKKKAFGQELHGGESGDANTNAALVIHGSRHMSWVHHTSPTCPLRPQGQSLFVWAKDCCAIGRIPICAATEISQYTTYTLSLSVRGVPAH